MFWYRRLAGVHRLPLSLFSSSVFSRSFTYRKSFLRPLEDSRDPLASLPPPRTCRPSPLCPRSRVCDSSSPFDEAETKGTDELVAEVGLTEEATTTNNSSQNAPRKSGSDGHHVETQPQNCLFDLHLAISLAEAAFDSYATIESSGIIQKSPPQNGVHVETTYIDEEFLSTIMVGLLKISLEDVRIHKSGHQSENPNISKEVGSREEIEDDATHAFEVCVGSDSWGKIGNKDKTALLFVQDPLRQGLRIDHVEENGIYVGKAMVALDDLIENNLYQESQMTNDFKKVKKTITLKYNEKSLAEVTLLLELITFSNFMKTAAVQNSNTVGEKFSLLSEPGQGLMTDEWKQLIQTASKEKDEIYKPAAFVENPRTNTQLWVFWNKYKKTLILAFRGTEQDKWRDILTDISLTPMPLDADIMAEAPRTVPLADISSDPGTLSKMLDKIEKARKELNVVDKKPGISRTLTKNASADRNEGPEVDYEVIDRAKNVVSAAMGAIASTTDDVQEILSRIKSIIQEEEENNERKAQKGCWVHSGFLSCYDSVRAQSLGLVESLLIADQKCKSISSNRVDGAEPHNEDSIGWTIAFTGHSLGGALATLAALDIGRRVKKLGVSLKMYNFGSPRIGNKLFATEFDETISDAWRIVNLNDAVANVPRLMGYHHVGHYVAIDQTGQVRIDHSRNAPFEGTSLEDIVPAATTAISNAIALAIPSVLQNDGTDFEDATLSSNEDSKEKKSEVSVDDEAITPERLEELWAHERDAWSMLLDTKSISEHMEAQYFKGNTLFSLQSMKSVFHRKI